MAPGINWEENPEPVAASLIVLGSTIKLHFEHGLPYSAEAVVTGLAGDAVVARILTVFSREPGLVGEVVGEMAGEMVGATFPLVRANVFGVK